MENEEGEGEGEGEGGARQGIMYFGVHVVTRYL